MKLQVITYTRTRNYGGILQAYGLYNYLSSCGYDVSFIDYVPERCNVEDVRVFGDCMTRQSRFWGRNVATKFAWRKIVYPRLREAYRPFREFLDTRCTFTRRYTCPDELMADPPMADVFITGSDQVWNSGFTADGKVDTPFYLPFADGRKISYASSFGTSSLDASNADEVRNLLEPYDAISVRERSGVEILESLGLHGVTVCDPTMLCDQQIWFDISSLDTDDDYVLLYQVRFDRETYESALKIARDKGKRLLVASMNPRDRWHVNEGSLVFPTIEEWLALIRQADSVITDSFHACVFSLLFNKQFLVNFGARRAMSSRITELLDRTGLSSRGFVSGDETNMLDCLDDRIDWGTVGRSIERYRAESRAWLSHALLD